MDLAQLRLFLTVAEHKSISAAADSLNMAQPALTKTIRRIEQRLGVPLFDRLPRGIALTAFGETMARHARLIQREYNHALMELDAMRGGSRGAVTLGAGSSWLAGLLPPAIARLLARRPDVQVRVKASSHDEIVQALVRGDIDFGLVALTEQERGPGELVGEPLIRDVLKVTVREGHPLSEAVPIDLAMLERWRWALHAGQFARSRLEELFRSGGLAPPQVAVETDSLVCLLDVVRASDLLTYLPQSQLRSPLGRGLTALPIAQCDRTRTAGFLFRRRGTLSPAARALVAELRGLSAEVMNERGAA